MSSLEERARALEVLTMRWFWWGAACAFWGLGLFLIVCSVRLLCAAFR
jgi:hypothetical protein